MSKPKPTLNEDNVFDVRMYFERLFQLKEGSNFYHSDIFIDGLGFEAEQKLEKIKENYNVSKEEETTAMRNWLENYITEKGWRRCINSLTQRKHRTARKNKKYHIDIPLEAWSTLNYLAGQASVTKTDLLVTLINEAYQSHFDKITS